MTACALIKPAARDYRMQVPSSDSRSVPLVADRQRRIGAFTDPTSWLDRMMTRTYTVAHVDVRWIPSERTQIRECNEFTEDAEVGAPHHTRVEQTIIGMESTVITLASRSELARQCLLRTSLEMSIISLEWFQSIPR